MITTRRNVIAGLGSILIGCCAGCHRGKQEPVTILFMDAGTRSDVRRRVRKRCASACSESLCDGAQVDSMGGQAPAHQARSRYAA
jgi:predicted Fe-S protein YdhL (DUF1289 family)